MSIWSKGNLKENKKVLDSLLHLCCFERDKLFVRDVQASSSGALNTTRYWAPDQGGNSHVKSTGTEVKYGPGHAASMEEGNPQHQTTQVKSSLVDWMTITRLDRWKRVYCF